MNPLLSSLRTGLGALLCSTFLASCAHHSAPADAAALLNDGLFPTAALPADAVAPLALSEPMKRFALANLSITPTRLDSRRALMQSLFAGGALKLSYDGQHTRNAAQAFESRSGNCLSLVMMTAAFAGYLGIPVAYQAVVIDAQYSRLPDLMVSSGHINLVLGPRRNEGFLNRPENDDLTVDFMPRPQRRGYQTIGVDQDTVLAMYWNNRAAEALADRQLDTAYALARAALKQAPDYHTAANTLAVVYFRKGEFAAAETALRRVLAHEPDNTAALSNLGGLLRRVGRTAEADRADARLAALQPYPPFHFLELGRQALDAGDAKAAREFFDKELDQQPLQHEVHFWAAQAYSRLGDMRRAAEHLGMALDNSPTFTTQAMYASMLARLRLQISVN